MKKLFIFLALFPLFAIGMKPASFNSNGGYMIQSLRYATQLEIPLFYAMRKLRTDHSDLGDWWVIFRDHKRTYRTRATVRAYSDTLRLDTHVPDQLCSFDIQFREILEWHATRIGFSSISIVFYVGGKVVGSCYKTLNSEHLQLYPK